MSGTGTQAASPRQRGVISPSSPFESMEIGDVITINTDSGTAYTVVRAKRGFAVLSSNSEVSSGRLLSLSELGFPVVGERWDFALVKRNNFGLRGTSPVIRILR